MQIGYDFLNNYNTPKKFSDDSKQKTYVINRQGEREEVSFDKILKRISTLSNNLSVNAHIITQETIRNIINDINTTEIDKISSSIAASYATDDPDYDQLAVKILISNDHKEQKDKFSIQMKKFYQKGQLNLEFMEIVNEIGPKIEKFIDHNRDYDYDIFGLHTLKKTYLLRTFIDNKEYKEKIQHMFMRFAIALHKKNIKNIRDTYHALSKKYISCPTPQYCNAGTKRQQFASCFLLGTEDSIDGMYETIKDIALISKDMGGIGLHTSNIRPRGSIINSTGMKSTGLIRYLKVLDSASLHVTQGGRRSMSCAIYLETWHEEFQDFLQMCLNNGQEQDRCREVFSAVFINDVFMKRLELGLKTKKPVMWTFLNQNTYPKLQDLYGQDFEQYYLESEQKQIQYCKSNNIKLNQIDIQELHSLIVKSQVETGRPYITFKDNINYKCNQNFIGTIKSSNLCAEINIYNDSQQYGVCNLSSLCLGRYVEYDPRPFVNYDKLDKYTRMLVQNLNIVIDISYYPVEKAKISNLNYRPIGIGVQGLADLFIKMKLPFESDEALYLQDKIFAQIYYSSLDESCNLVQKYGLYKDYHNSLLSKGILQFDLWKQYKNPSADSKLNLDPHPDFDWDKLKKRLINEGAVNSLLLAQMPTASTSIIMQQTESIEPITAPIFCRKNNSGEFWNINRYLVNDLKKQNLWNKQMFDLIYTSRSIQDIPDIPSQIKSLYKSIWDIKQSRILLMSANRGKYICQSQSQNIYIPQPSLAQMQASIIYAWKNGLKTGCYYLRTQPAHYTQKFTIQSSKQNTDQHKKNIEGETQQGVNQTQSAQKIPTNRDKEHSRDGPAPSAVSVLCPQGRSRSNQKDLQFISRSSSSSNQISFKNDIDKESLNIPPKPGTQVSDFDFCNIGDKDCTSCGS